MKTIPLDNLMTLISNDARDFSTVKFQKSLCSTKNDKKIETKNTLIVYSRQVHRTIFAFHLLFSNYIALNHFEIVLFAVSLQNIKVWLIF